MKQKDEEFEKHLEKNISVFDKISLSEEKKQEIAANIRSVINAEHRVPFYKSFSFKKIVSASVCLLITLTASLAFALTRGLEKKEAFVQDSMEYRVGGKNQNTDSTSEADGGDISPNSNYDIGYSYGSCEEMSFNEEYSEENEDVSEDFISGCVNSGEDSGTLFAIEINDNLSYSALASACSKYPGIFSSNINPYNRVAVKVTSGGMPAFNVTVYGLDVGGNTVAEARTDINGNAYLYGGLSETDGAEILSIKACDVYSEITGGTAVIETEKQPVLPSSADIMFVFDTSAAMEEKLDYFKSNLEGIIDGVTKNSGVGIRLSLNFRCDGGTMAASSAFTPDVSKTVSFLKSIQCRGSSSTDIDKILMDVVHAYGWEDDSLKICVLVLGNSADMGSEACENIKTAVEEAQKMGVRFIPVVESDTDVICGCLYRTLAATTGGTTALITDTYGTEESGSDCSTPKAEELGSLLLRVISSYLKPDTEGNVN